MSKCGTPCNACFPAGSRPASRTFGDAGGALTIYSGLLASGLLPTMCQQADGRYRVCHLRETASCERRLPETRAA